MKRFLLVFLIILSSSVAFSQCPDNLTLTSQQAVDNFPVLYPNCTELIFVTEISGSDITNLDGLSNITSASGMIVIHNNPLLTSIEGLSNLTTISRNIQINNNPVLSSLTGLESLEYIGENIRIDNNDSLTDLTGLNNLVTVEEGVIICNNDGLVSLDGLNKLINPGGISIWDNPLLSDLSNMNYITSVNGQFLIRNNNSLTSLNGFENLNSVSGHMFIESNYFLESLAGLGSLSTIGGNFTISSCTALPDLYGLENLVSLGGNLEITDNNALESLVGIDNLQESSIANLVITYNPQLSYCHVASICDYLSSPNGNITIYVNNSGCNNSTEIHNLCLVSISKNEKNCNISVYPNPTDGIVTIEANNIISTNVTSLAGVTVMNQNDSPKIDMSNLPDGIYFLSIITKNGVFTERIMVRHTTP